MGALVWFRGDLRIDDNGALARALAAGGHVEALFLAAPAQWRAHDWGERRQRFVIEHALALRGALAAHGVPLHIAVADRFADAPAAVCAAAVAAGATVVCANAEYGVNELARDRAVATALAAAGIGWQCLDDATLLPPGSVRTQEGNAFRVYSPFKRALFAVAARIPRAQRPDFGGRAPVEPPPLPDLSQLPAEAAVPDAQWWPIGEDAARERLERFVAGALRRYAQDRDVPAVDGTSRLSPYLAAGVISPRRCLEAALAANHGEFDSGDPGAVAWINELVWREFYLHTLVAWPHVSRHRAWLARGELVPWRHAPEDFARWQQGRTGFPLVDAAMRQLAATGWMHNRLRMVCAMFLSKYLLLDWHLGERHFMEQLVDGDLASNNGGWQWSASTGTDAAPYFRLLSPVRQAERFDADAAFVRHWLPELADLPAKTLLRPGHPALLARGYPPPMVDLAAARLRVLEVFRSIAEAPPAE